MKLIELHILQSYPVSCLNRDDVGAPKSATFGGVSRARISSQCLKRAVRLAAAEESPENFKGERTRLIITPIQSRLCALGIEQSLALEASKLFCDGLSTFDEKAEKKGVLKVKTMTMFSPLELDEIAAKMSAILKDASFGPIATDSKKREAQAKKLLTATDAAKKAALKDAADIALFGRMVASDHSLTLEGAAMFSHAISTHKATNDVDYWTAVDDRQKDDPTVSDGDRAGSGGLGTAEFTSATYYRYAAVNLGLLADQNHLGALPPEDRRVILKSFIKATLMAVPGARKNSMNAATLPFAVLGIRKDKGQPVQLVNAFESPVKATGKGFDQASREAMEDEYKKLKETWGIETTKELWMPESNLNDFLEGLTDGL
jgi:CRISPR system Cascade subunit CasC